MSDELAHQTCPLCRRSSGLRSGTPPITKLCERCRSLVATAFGGRMPVARQPAQSAAGLNVAYGADIEYSFEQKSEPAPVADSSALDFESGPETESSEKAVTALTETRFDVISDELQSKEAELPEWDYSQGEWPVLLSPAGHNPLARFKTALFVVAVLAVSAAFYFFVLPTFQEQHPKPTAQERASVIPKPAVSDADSQNARTSQTPPSSSQTPTEPYKVGEAVNAHGKFALQAAAFLSQTEADVLADKLKAAGVPSYVVRADLARRGRWFRVRVGRFNTGEEAQRFAAEAQPRAKAAEVSLQLVVVPYEQP